MQTLYSMNLNGRFVTNWTDLQLACECLETAIQVLAQAGATASLELEKSALLNGTKNGTKASETLALFEISDGGWATVGCTVRFEDGTYKEVSK